MMRDIIAKQILMLRQRSIIYLFNSFLILNVFDGWANEVCICILFISTFALLLSYVLLDPFDMSIFKIFSSYYKICLTNNNKVV